MQAVRMTASRYSSSSTTVGHIDRQLETEALRAFEVSHRGQFAERPFPTAVDVTTASKQRAVDSEAVNTAKG